MFSSGLTSDFETIYCFMSLCHWLCCYALLILEEKNAWNGQNTHCVC